MSEEEILVEAKGILRYERRGNFYKLIASTDDGIANLYRSLIPKWIPVKGQRYRAHVSIVRKEVPKNLKAWGLHEGEEVNFLYSRMIYNDENYWWLNVFCKRFEEIRRELGLPEKDKFLKPLEGYSSVFHLTLGNTK